MYAHVLLLRHLVIVRQAFCDNNNHVMMMKKRRPAMSDEEEELMSAHLIPIAVFPSVRCPFNLARFFFIWGGISPDKDRETR